MHGDGKATTSGAYHIDTIHATDGVYEAKFVGPGGGTAAEVEWPAATEPPPDATTIISELRAKA